MGVVGDGSFAACGRDAGLKTGAPTGAPVRRSYYDLERGDTAAARSETFV